MCCTAFCGWQLSRLVGQPTYWKPGTATGAFIPSVRHPCSRLFTRVHSPSSCPGESSRCDDAQGSCPGYVVSAGSTCGNLFAGAVPPTLPHNAATLTMTNDECGVTCVAGYQCPIDASSSVAQLCGPGQWSGPDSSGASAPVQLCQGAMPAFAAPSRES